MLIYNSKKEFIGIDENDLKALGFENLSELRTQATDFADLFVKTPGYIHNFKHVNWIDYIACSDSSESPKVIIHANSDSFKCTLDVKTAFLTDDPSSKAFLVQLNNVRQLTDGEHRDVSADIKTKISQAAITPVHTENEIAAQEPVEETVKEPEEAAQELNVEESISEQIEEIDNVSSSAEQSEIVESPIDLDIPLDVDFSYDEDEKLEPALDIETETSDEELKLDLNIEEDSSKDEELKLDLNLEEDSLQEEEYSEMGIYDNGYVYDPQIASDELGLPIDLIEEFIEDFVAQAKEFKPQLYKSLDDGEYDDVKILSHKLKGVAANLRIEDAFETLTLINTSNNHDETLVNLDTLYKIISKLSGEKIPLTKKKPIKSSSEKTQTIAASDKSKTDNHVVAESENEIHALKDIDEPEQKEENSSFDSISDNEVPEKINIPELADDDFLNQEDDVKIELNDNLNIETISEEETKSIENESIDIGEIELLDEHNTQEDDEVLTMSDSDSDSKPIFYDKTIIASEIGIPYNSFLELFDDYLNEAQELSNTISSAIDANDSKTWRTKAVQLKGMSDNMRIHEFTKELEALMRTEDKEVASDAYVQIEKSITEISNLKG